MTYNKALEICEKINEYLKKEFGGWFDVFPYGDDIPVIGVEVVWGDWKHEHMALKWLMDKIGVFEIGCRVTEENGSDCYSAIHWFAVDENMFDKKESVA